MHGFSHEALIYEDRDEFAAGAVRFLREGIAAEEVVLIAVAPEKEALLKGELGADAGAARFFDMRALGRNPARLIPFWREFIDAQGDRPGRGLGEPVWPGRTPAEIDECERHEALLNLAFGGDRGWSMLCPYDGGALTDEVLEGVARSHPHVHRDGETRSNGSFLADPDCFAGPLPGRPPVVASFRFGQADLHKVRSWVGHAACDAGMPTGEAADLVAAASEVAANSIAYGGGGGSLHIWRDPAGVVVEIADAGRIEEPLAGRVRPAPSQRRGRGLWLANQLCDLVQIRSGAAGTTVRLRGNLA
jgi:anti-sigma regulatory factor (Ser/Thr protein kinase)